MKRIQVRCQIGHLPGMKAAASSPVDADDRPGHSNREAWLPERHLVHWTPCVSSILHECVRLHTLCLIPFLVHDGADVDETDPSGITALHAASRTLSREAIQMLLRCGANVNLAAPATGLSPLHFAAQSASSKGGIILAAGAECVKLLLQNGAQVSARDGHGKEAIHFACQGGRVDLVTLLLDYGADVNSLTSRQESPLFLFLDAKTNLRKAQLLNTLLHLSYPLRIANAENSLPAGLHIPSAGHLKDALLRLASDVLSLQDICKFNVRKLCRGGGKDWMETKLPANLWKSIYVDQEFSYASKLKAQAGAGAFQLAPKGKDRPP
ncbi:ankyrin repeat domain-containing protein 61 [Paroedura picta]|uniref:ankyrin repeat domain-containing protein 61 n=1 Tax=Paroedura picta TaxID=143630 RepID=UPI004055E760